MIQTTPPIFVADSGDLDVFRSVGEALAYVEPWDVSATLQVFDASGRRLKIVAEGVKRTRRTVSGGSTLLDEGAPVERAPSALAAVLRDYIGSVGPVRFGWDHERLAAASLEDLVSAVAVHYGLC
jgi:hypothetical protein